MNDTKTIDLTPRFVYTEPVDILKRFIEQVSEAAAKGGFTDSGSRAIFIADVVDGIESSSMGVYAARQAMKEVLTQDIELQIAHKTFPLPKRVVG